MLKFGPPIFIPNPAGIAGLEDNLIVEAAMKGRAEKIVETAKGAAPVRTGAFRDSIHVDENEGDVVAVADVDYAVYVELGTSDTPAFAVLRRAAEVI